ncbi:hypothetical protein D3C72_2353600 [compost metagenome]
MSCAETSLVRLMRGSYMVRSRPSIFSAGLSIWAMRWMLLIRSLKPSRAKYSHCMGMITPSAATRALTVSIDSAGGQSMRM